MATKDKFRAALVGTRAALEPDQEDSSEAKPFGEGVREQMERNAESITIQQIPIEQLVDNPFQHLARPDQNDEDLEELANSMRTVGFYGALLARRTKTGSYELAYGHRRKQAALRAGLKTLPVKVMELTDEEMLKVMASENFSRLDLEPLNEANVVGVLSENYNLSAREIAEMIGKKRGWVEQRLALYNAPADVKALIAERPNTIGHVLRLVTVTDPEQRALLLKAILEENLTRAQLEERIALIKPKPVVSTPQPQQPQLYSPEPQYNIPASQGAQVSLQENTATNPDTISFSSKPSTQPSSISQTATNEVAQPVTFVVDTPLAVPANSLNTNLVTNQAEEASQPDYEVQKFISTWRQHLYSVGGPLTELENATEEIDENWFQPGWFSDNDRQVVEQYIRRLQKILTALE